MSTTQRIRERLFPGSDPVTASANDPLPDGSRFRLEPGDSWPMRLALLLLRSGPLLILISVCVWLSLASPFFLTQRNITNLGFQTSIVAVLALGQLLVILTRGIDLSVGSVVALSSVLGAMAAGPAWYGGGAGVILIIVLVGGAVGLVNGLVIVKGRVMNPFIVTLGTLSIVRGVALLVSDAQTLTTVPNAVIEAGSGQVGPIPIPTLVVLTLASLAWILTTRTQWGRWIYAIGGSPDAARRVGIPVDRVLISVYILCGLSAGIAGMLVAGRTGAGSPIEGAGLELDAITAVIIGGASFFGGRGNVWNVLIGALIIGVIGNGLNLLDVTPFWRQVAIGTLVITSIELDLVRAKIEERLRARRALLAQ